MTLDVYDVRGRYVKTLQSGPMDAGTHAAFWDGSGGGTDRVSAGIYFARLSVAGGKSVQTRVVVLD